MPLDRSMRVRGLIVRNCRNLAARVSNFTLSDAPVGSGNRCKVRRTVRRAQRIADRRNRRVAMIDARREGSVA